MTREEILKGKADIISEFGEWSGHNVHLGHEIYTISPTGPFDYADVRRIVQAVADVTGKSLAELRVLDLACLEGAFGLEFAARGSTVVGIEGREMNIVKARFAKEALNLSNIEFYRDDVRNLTPKKYGRFDVVLCLGLLYHLDAPDVFELVESISAVTTRLAVIDTHTSVADLVEREYKGHAYFGRLYGEFPESATEEEKAKSPGSSLDNPLSFWLTRPSLYNLIAHSGFSSAYEIVNAYYLKEGFLDRPSIVAIKGNVVSLETSPAASWPLPDWPEREGRRLHPDNLPDPTPKWKKVAKAVKHRLVG